MNLIYHFEDSGFCRIYYKVQGRSTIFCIQEDSYGPGHVNYAFMPCTDGYLEPIGDIGFERIKAIDYLPETERGKEVATWLKQHYPQILLP